MNEEMFETNDKGAKIAVLIVIIVAILCVLGYFVYDILFNRPSLKLLSFISKIDEWEIFKEESVKLSGDLTIEAKTKDLKFLEDASSNYAIIADDKKDTIMFTFNYKEKDNTIFVLDGYIDDKIAAFKSDKIFDNNVLYADIKDEVKNNQESDFEYIIGIYAKALATSFKAEKPVKEEIKVTINNDTIKLKENKYIVTKENVEKINNNYRKSILNDDKALTILAKYSTKTKEEIKKEVEKEYYLVDPKDLEGNFFLSVYTKGLFNSFAGFALGENEDKIIEYIFNNDYNYLKLDSTEDAMIIVEGKIDSLKYKLTDGKEDLITGNIVKYSDNNYAVTMEMKDMFELKLTLKEDKDLKLEKIDTENAKLIDEISDEEYEKYRENLEKTLESSEVYTKFITVLLETENE